MIVKERNNTEPVRATKTLMEPVDTDFKPIVPKLGTVGEYVARNVLHLRYSADLRTLGTVTLYFVTLAWCWAYLEATCSYFLLALAVMFLSVLSFSCATITHNSVHCHPFERGYEMRNHILFLFLSLTYGHPVSSFVPGHNLSHHKHTQTVRDHMRTSKLRFRLHILNLIFFQPAVAWTTLTGDIEYALLQARLGRPFFLKLLREAAFVSSISVYLLYQDPLKFLLFWHLPHLFAQWAIVSVNLLQHDGCDTSLPGDLRKVGNTARTFSGGFINYIFFNNGYHEIHHVKPNLHWSLLPQAHEKICAPFLDPRLDEPNMGLYIWRTFFYPGQRLRFDGKPVVLALLEEDQDEPWIVYPSKIQEKMNHETALSLMLLLACRVLSPMYSPFGDPDIFA